MLTIIRGEIWLIDLNPIRGHEQAGKRPCLVVSVDLFHQGASGHWFSLIEGRKSHWAKVREIKKPI
jgi:mRNA-degrading endonuclease toxin of MazEF toxin-antitoxin module